MKVNNSVGKALQTTNNWQWIISESVMIIIEIYSHIFIRYLLNTQLILERYFHYLKGFLFFFLPFISLVYKNIESYYILRKEYYNVIYNNNKCIPSIIMQDFHVHDTNSHIQNVTSSSF